MSLLPVSYFGDPVLRTKGAKVEKFDADLAKLAEDMFETMKDERGIGLAAQQVGLALQFFVMDLRPGKDVEIDFTWTYDGKAAPLESFMPISVANAAVEILPDDEWLYEEGCLSFPGLRGEVARQEKVRMKFQDIHGKAHELVCDGLFARCIQHEHDHCQGVLFIDRMEAADLAKIRNKVVILKRETEAAVKERKKAEKEAKKKA
jgi:peptide deformylase